MKRVLVLLNARAGMLIGLETTAGAQLGTALTTAAGTFSIAKPDADTVWLTISDPMDVYHFGAQLLPILVQGVLPVEAAGGGVVGVSLAGAI